MFGFEGILHWQRIIPRIRQANPVSAQGAEATRRARLDERALPLWSRGSFVKCRSTARCRQMSVTLHTSLGDVKIEIFCDTVPRTAFNFLALAASGYYDGTLFHRNVKGFMVQGGDPTGTGKGGESIWGGKFADEIHPENKHTARGIVSMANSVR